MRVRRLAVGLAVSCLWAAAAYAACTDVAAAKAAVASITVPDCPARGGGRAVRHARTRLRTLLVHADMRCAHGKDARASALLERTASILAAADTRLEHAIGAGKLDA